MSDPDQSTYEIRFEWGEAGLRALAPRTRTFVVVDVLSFSTSVAIVCRRGAVVLPYGGAPDRLHEFARAHDAVAAAARSPASAAYSLSPASLTRIPPGTRLALPSPNGSSLCVAAAAAGTVVAGCLRNAAAVAARVGAIGGPVAVIAAGERWPDEGLRPALEDLVGAGAIIARLQGRSSPEAEAARSRPCCRGPSFAAFERVTDGGAMRHWWSRPGMSGAPGGQGL